MLCDVSRVTCHERLHSGVAISANVSSAWLVLGQRSSGAWCWCANYPTTITYTPSPVHLLHLQPGSGHTINSSDPIFCSRSRLVAAARGAGRWYRATNEARKTAQFTPSRETRGAPDTERGALNRQREGVYCKQRGL